MVQGSFKGVSRKIEGCSKSLFRVIQGSFKYLKEVQREFQGSFKDILRMLKKVSSVFQENFINKLGLSWAKLSQNWNLNWIY